MNQNHHVLTDADEKHMREIEMEQGIVTTPRYFAEGQKEINKKPKMDGSVAFRVDPQDVEDFDDTDDSARESDEGYYYSRTPRTVERKVKKAPRKPMKPLSCLKTLKDHRLPIEIALCMSSMEWQRNSQQKNGSKTGAWTIFSCSG